MRSWTRLSSKFVGAAKLGLGSVEPATDPPGEGPHKARWRIRVAITTDAAEARAIDDGAANQATAWVTQSDKQDDRQRERDERAE